ncbi:MAG TPA: hypothetical protein VK179_13815 [Bacteroidales bacterium]|nr:hypothetical protein [Bacteroidales bacterium]
MISLSNKKLLPIRRDGQIEVGSAEGFRSNSTVPSGSSSIPPDKYASYIHALVDTVHHPVSDLTPGHILTALTATTYGFAAPPTIPDNFLFNTGDIATGEYIFTGNIKIDTIESRDIVFSPGFLGAGWKLQSVNDKYNLEIDNLTVRNNMSIYELDIVKLQASEDLIISRGGVKATSNVIEGDPGTYYFTVDEIDAYILAEDDIIHSQEFNGNNVHSLYLEVVSVDTDNNRVYVDLSDTEEQSLYSSLAVTNVSFSSFSWVDPPGFYNASGNTGNYAETELKSIKAGTLNLTQTLSVNNGTILVQLIDSSNNLYSTLATLVPASGDNLNIDVNIPTDIQLKVRYKANAASTSALIYKPTLTNDYTIPLNLDDYQVLNYEFVQVGNLTDTDRQSIIEINANQLNNPNIRILDDVNSQTITQANVMAQLGNLTGLTYGGSPLTSFGIYTKSIYIDGGGVANWTISDSAIYKNIDTGGAGMSPADYPFYAGRTYANRANSPFQVFPDGSVIISNSTTNSKFQFMGGSVNPGQYIWGGLPESATNYLLQIVGTVDPLGYISQTSYSNNYALINLKHYDTNAAADHMLTLEPRRLRFKKLDGVSGMELNYDDLTIIELIGGVSTYYPAISPFGSGIDGDVTIAAGTTTLTRDMEYDSLTIQTGATLRTAGFTVRVRKLLKIEGTGMITCNSGSKTVPYTHRLHSAACLGTGGNKGTSSSPTSSAVSAGGAAGSVTNANTTSVPFNFFCGAGGGGGGAIGTSPVAGTAGSNTAWGAAGGAGGTATYGGTAALLSGGDGGAGAGYLEVWAHTVNNASGADGINANGTPGGNGATSGSSKSGNGGGGGGGCVILYYHEETGSGLNTTPQAIGGAAGTGGNGGAAGSNGIAYAYQI